VTRFTGSQRVDERRRRRLAVESEITEAPFASAPRKSAGRRAAGATPFRPAEFIRGDCPVLCLIPPQLWKHLLAAGVGVLFAAGLLACGHHEAAWVSKIGPGVSRLCSLSRGALFDWYSEALLVGASQMALLIWWARSRSLKDFAGSYHIWGWAAALWLTLSLCLATGAHRAWSEALVFLWPSELKGHETFCWLAPAVLVGNWLLIRLRQEMHACRGSRWVFVAAALLYAGAAIVHLRSESVGRLIGGDLTLLLLDGLLLSGHLSLLLSMALHARHVLYITAEPPARPLSRSASRWMAARGGMSKCLQALRLRFVRKPRAVRGAPAAKTPAKRTRRKPATRKAVVAASVENDEEVLQDEAAEAEEMGGEDAEELDAEQRESEAENSEEEQESEEASGEWEEAADEESEESDSDGESEGTGHNFRVDSAESGPRGSHSGQKSGDPDDLKGLSKRERRKLQQQQREQERAQRHGR
jgi:hypothetical protein